MRRVLGLVLVGLGAACIAMAALLQWYVAPSLVTAPLDQFAETVSVAEGATYLDLGALEVREGRTLIATRTVRGDVPAGNDDRAVYDVFVKIIDPDKPGTGEEQLVTATTDRVAFDRRTSEAVNCCDENVNGGPVQHAGIEYKFPFDAQQRTYQYFDTSIAKATDMKFVDEEEIEGLTVYKYEQRIEPTKIADADVPGGLVGDEQPSLTLGQYYSNTRTAWVEPTTGVIVRGTEQQHSTLRDANGLDRLVITDANLAFTDETVKAQSDSARDAMSSARLLSSTGPVVALLLGVVLADLGLFAIFRRSRADGDGVTADEREPAVV